MFCSKLMHSVSKEVFTADLANHCTYFTQIIIVFSKPLLKTRALVGGILPPATVTKVLCTLQNGDVFNKRALFQCCLTSNPSYSHDVEAVILRPQTSNEEPQFYSYKRANFSLADLCTKFSA